MLAARYETRFQGFHGLMKHRVREILLVSTLYDAFVLEEDRSLSERLFSEYLELDLRFVPRITRVSSAKEALELLEHRQFHLVLSMVRLPDMRALEFRRRVKARFSRKPVIFLTYDTVDDDLKEALLARSTNDRVFYWTRDTNLLLAIVKYVEDLRNVTRDTKAGVQVILLVEDSPRFVSLYLPHIYTELVLQTRHLLSESYNHLHRLMRMRARPKILVADTYGKARKLFRQYKRNIIGVITDVEFRKGQHNDPEAGFKLAAAMKADLPDLPILMQSSNSGNKSRAHAAGYAFLNKGTTDIGRLLGQRLRHDFGFGDFIFRMDNGQEVARAHTIQEMVNALHTIPDESLLKHSGRNHISTWLRARVEFAIAAELRPLQLKDFNGSVPALRAHLAGALAQYSQKDRDGIIREYSHGSIASTSNFIKLGQGSLGGKARGLAFMNALLARSGLSERHDNVPIRVPNTFVLCTGVFEDFLEKNALRAWAMEETDDDAIIQRFLAGQLPNTVRSQLREILSEVDYPIAVRSSSAMEDNQSLPLAGIYRTYMLPNNHRQLERRLWQVCDAVKIVYASIFLQSAKAYLRNTGLRPDEEQMAVILQEIVGTHRDTLFYPTFSGVAQSHNYYPLGAMKAEHGMVSLALGLGKSVVDSERVFHFCPEFPRANPPFSSPEEQLQNSQSHFFALDMSRANINVTEDEAFSLVRQPLSEAEPHGTLQHLASTYSGRDHRIRDTLMAQGPRVITFAPVLKYDTMPLPEILKDLLKVGQESFRSPVEIEFAVEFDENQEQPTFYFLQIRPMSISDSQCLLDKDQLKDPDLICASTQAMGNGCYPDLYDIVFVDPERFDILETRAIAAELGTLNQRFLDEGRGYVLIGFGRWATSDPSLGVPVNWSQISEARVFVESDRDDLWVEPSQGSHFFQNMLALQLGYLFVKQKMAANTVHWDWLTAQTPFYRTEHLIHVRFDDPLHVEIDGRNSRGLVGPPRAPDDLK